MELKDLQKHWDLFGHTDPLWAILAVQEKRGGKWDPEEFFQTGRQEVGWVLGHARALGLEHGWGRALDFGCGAGRLTQALGEHFAECHGVDIAPSMIELARRYNRHGDRCSYHLNETDNLRLFGDRRFDFICSCIVLQHIESRHAKRYLREFIRLLAPGGVLVFQLPSHLALDAGNLPAAACRARIRLRERSLRAPPSSAVCLRVGVENASPLRWPARSRIRLGNHWLQRQAWLAGYPRVLRFDDGRVDLPCPINPGESVEVDLTVSTPVRPGQYLLELDVMQEGVIWFRQHGSPTTRVPVILEGRAAAPVAAVNSLAALPAVTVPVMEMHPIRKAEVLEWMAACGGRVVDAQPSGSAGADWVSYHYYVTRNN